MIEDTQIAIVLGTRPEIIKMSPIIRECEYQNIEYTVIHTGQHYSENLDKVFFEDLELPMPEYNLQVGSKSPGRQTGEMISGIEKILLDEKPDTVLVQGDTNSVLAGAIATDKIDMKLGHVEAGLRSFDRSMPEESNRRATDHLSDYLFAPTDSSAQLLQQEGISEDRIFITGNTVVDAVQQNSDLAAEKSNVLNEYGLQSEKYILLTAHRAENVDDDERFKHLLEGAHRVGREFDIDIIYPIHPRALNKAEEFGIAFPDSIQVIDPLDYIEFLTLEQNANLILTDSGGVQEEACILHVPCITLRDNTERPETIDVGSNRLAGTNPEEILSKVLEAKSMDTNWRNPFGDGNAATKILQAVQSASVETEISS